jgi:acyl-coenzyme A thioesterase PaaI-like protein
MTLARSGVTDGVEMMMSALPVFTLGMRVAPVVRDEFELQAPVLGEQLGHFDIGAGGLHGGVHHAGRRNREVGR